MDEINKMLDGIGALAEMTHVFYRAMILSGAGKLEAAMGMAAFIFVYLNKPSLE